MSIPNRSSVRRTTQSEVQAYIENGRLHVSVPLLRNPKPSSTGKTTIIATSGGNKDAGVLHDNKPVKVGVFAFIPRVNDQGQPVKVKLPQRGRRAKPRRQ